MSSERHSDATEHARPHANELCDLGQSRDTLIWMFSGFQSSDFSMKRRERKMGGANIPYMV